MAIRFKYCHKSGQLLVHVLAGYTGRKDVLVLAIPPGGVAVAAAIAQGLECAMDVLTVRTLNVPQHDPSWNSYGSSGTGRSACPRLRGRHFRESPASRIGAVGRAWAARIGAIAATLHTRSCRKCPAFRPPVVGDESMFASAPNSAFW